MGGLVWDPRKNEKLRRERGVTFEDVVQAMAEGRILAVMEHPNQSRYPGQRILIVEVKGYAYLVPYTEDGGDLVFKTVIPSRKASRDVLKGGKKHG